MEVGRLRTWASLAEGSTLLSVTGTVALWPVIPESTAELALRLVVVAPEKKGNLPALSRQGRTDPCMLGPPGLQDTHLSSLCDPSLGQLEQKQCWQ